MDLEAFFTGGGHTDDEDEARWGQLQKMSFRLRTGIQELLLDQSTLLLEELQETEVRLRRQKDQFGKGKGNPAPPPASKQRSGGAVKGRRAGVTSSAGAAAPAGQAAVREKDLQEKQSHKREMFEKLEELLEVSKCRHGMLDGGTASAERPLRNFAAARWLEIPKSSPAYEKAQIFDDEDVMAFSRLSDWLAESVSFAEKLVRATTGLAYQTEAIQNTLMFNVDDYLVDAEEGDPLENEAEEQGNQGTKIKPESDVSS